MSEIFTQNTTHGLGSQGDKKVTGTDIAGGKRGLDVNVAAGTVELGATSLAALENINVTVTSIGEVEVKNDSGSPVPVSGTVTANPPTTTAGTPAGVTVSASAAVIKASNANRKAIIITNNGNSNIYLGHSSAVTISGATMGLLLLPGGVYRDAGPGLYTGDIYGIGDASAASENVSVSERT